MNTVSYGDTETRRIGESEKQKDDEEIAVSPRHRFSASVKLSKLRRFVLLGIIILFLLQFLRVKILVGGLTGSLAVWFVKFMDVFAYFESLIAWMDFN